MSASLENTVQQALLSGSTNHTGGDTEPTAILSTADLRSAFLNECVVVTKYRNTDGVPDFDFDNWAPDSQLEKDYIREHRYKKTLDELTESSNFYAIWRCKQGHAWKASINSRKGGKVSCRQCINVMRGGGQLLSKALQDECVVVTKYDSAQKIKPFPFDSSCAEEERKYIEAHRHPTLTAAKVKAGSDWQCVWRCSKQHVWTTSCGARKRTKCSACSNQDRQTDRTLSDQYRRECVAILGINHSKVKPRFDDPRCAAGSQRETQFLKENPPHQRETRDTVKPSSGLYALWRCETCQHAWVVAVCNRKGCPECILSARRGHEEKKYLDAELQADVLVVTKFAHTQNNADIATFDPSWAVDSADAKEYIKLYAHTSKPSEVTAGSGRIIVWRCRRVLHGTPCNNIWQTAAKDRKSVDHGCSTCKRNGWQPNAGAKLSDRLQRECVVVTKHRKIDDVPHFDSSWSADSPDEKAYIEAHQHDSDDYRPSTVSAGSGFVAIWRCQHGHAWPLPCAQRSKGRNCPTCAERKRRGNEDEEKLSDELQRECVVVTNHTKSDDVPHFDSSWSADSRDEKDYIEAHQHVSFRPSTVSAGSSFVAIWRCQHGHIWKADCCKRTHGKTCIECNALKRRGGVKEADAKLSADMQAQCVVVTEFNKASTEASDLPFFDPAWLADSQERKHFIDTYRHKEGLDAATITRGSGFFVVWQCCEGHITMSPPSTRLKGGCSQCSANKLRGGREAAVLEEDLRKECVVVTNHRRTKDAPVFNARIVSGSQEERDYIKDHKHETLTPSTVTTGSDFVAVWRCSKVSARNGAHSCGHVWLAQINSRSRGGGCPSCALGEFGWNVDTLRMLIHSLLDDEGTINDLDLAELHALFKANGALNSHSTAAPLLRIIDQLPAVELRKFAHGEASIADSILADVRGGIELQDALARHAPACADGDTESAPGGYQEPCALAAGERKPGAEDAPVHADAAADGPPADTAVQPPGRTLEALNRMLGVLDRRRGGLDGHGRESSGGALSSDNELADFLIQSAAAKLWRGVFARGSAFVEELRSVALGAEVHSYVRETRERFLSQYDSAEQLPSPDGYSFADANGNPVRPYLMQRLVASRLMEANCRGLGNWTDTGGGKTLSALLTARHLKAEATLVLCPPGVAQQWAREAERYFAGVFAVHVVRTLKEGVHVSSDGSKPLLLVLHYVQLSLHADAALSDFAASPLGELLTAHPPTLIVLDELHALKIRKDVRGRSQVVEDETQAGDDDDEDPQIRTALPELSKRRQLAERLVMHARRSCPALKVLGLTATPLINELSEARSLLTMVSGRDFTDLKCPARPSVDHCMAVHRYLVIHGLRFRDEATRAAVAVEECRGGEAYTVDAREEYRTVTIAAHQDGKRRPTTMQCRLARVRAKLPLLVRTCLDARRRGKPVVVYTHYYGGGILEAIEGALADPSAYEERATPLTVARFTGLERLREREDTKMRFTGHYAGHWNDSNEWVEYHPRCWVPRETIDVLIGSQPICTGIDGLQTVCSTMFVLLLPMTHGEWHQLKGRLRRKGQTSEKVTYFVPFAALDGEDGERVSEDLADWERIALKGTIADATIDGELPPDQRAKLETSREDVPKQLMRILDRFDEDGALLANRPLADSDVEMDGDVEMDAGESSEIEIEEDNPHPPPPQDKEPPQSSPVPARATRKRRADSDRDAPREPRQRPAPDDGTRRRKEEQEEFIRQCKTWAVRCLKKFEHRDVHTVTALRDAGGDGAKEAQLLLDALKDGAEKGGAGWADLHDNLEHYGLLD